MKCRYERKRYAKLKQVGSEDGSLKKCVGFLEKMYDVVPNSRENDDESCMKGERHMCEKKEEEVKQLHESYSVKE